MTSYKLPIIRFAPSNSMLNGYGNDPTTSLCDIKHYQLLNNSFNEKIHVKDTTTVAEFVQEYLGRLNVKRSKIDKRELPTISDLYKRYDVVIKFQLFDKRQEARHHINVKIKLVSMIEKNLDLINLFEDIIIYNFYDFNHDTMMTKILDLVTGLDQ